MKKGTSLMLQEKPIDAGGNHLAPESTMGVGLYHNKRVNGSRAVKH